MKTRVQLSLMFILLVNSLTLSQSIGISAGYGSLIMDKVNKDMNDVRNFFRMKVQSLLHRMKSVVVFFMREM